jgi:lathosterol oxidase
MLGLVMAWTVLIHDRTPVCQRVGHQSHAGRHTAHHWYNKYNYGQFFTFWDRLCGTCREPDGRAG